MKVIRLLCLFIFLINGYSARSADSLELKTTNGISILEKNGYELFHQVPDSGNVASCVSCHNASYIDTFNWNPSLPEIAFRIKDLPLEEFTELLNDPFGSDRLMEAHQGYAFSDSSAIALKTYIETQTGNIIQKPKVFPTKNVLLYVLLGLCIVVFADYFILKKISNLWIHRGVFIVSITAIFLLIESDIRMLGLQEGYAPVQPVKFSHKLHAGDNQINCLYCHSSAMHTSVAGFPALAQCMNCHAVVREGSNSGAVEIDKLQKAFQNGKPLRWVRINNLPAHVSFNHAIHVAGGNLECKDCHGDLEIIHQINQPIGLSMKWCLDCHKSKKVNPAFNNYYSQTYRTADTLLVEAVGGWDCIKCHK